jgi:hypothetical protein
MSIERPLLELFAAFATVHHFDSTVQTVAQGVGGMCVKCSSSKRSELNRAKVNAARDSALAAAERASSTDAAAKKYDEMLKRLETLPNPLHGVSGKDFLLPLIDFHLQSIGCRVKRKSLRIRLAGAGDVGRYDNLATALSAAARGFS